MFERYTTEARRTIFYACYECFLLDAKEITPQLLLLGLSREFGTFAERLRARREDAATLRELFNLPAVPLKHPARMKVPPAPLSRNLKIALAAAATEADLDHSLQIKPDHLLRALMTFENEATPAFCLMGLDLEGVRKASQSRKRWSRQNIVARLRFLFWKAGQSHLKSRSEPT